MVTSSTLQQLKHDGMIHRTASAERCNLRYAATLFGSTPRYSMAFYVRENGTEASGEDQVAKRPVMSKRMEFSGVARRISPDSGPSTGRDVRRLLHARPPPHVRYGGQGGCDHVLDSGWEDSLEGTDFPFRGSISVSPASTRGRPRPPKFLTLLSLHATASGPRQPGCTLTLPSAPRGLPPHSKCRQLDSMQCASRGCTSFQGVRSPLRPTEFPVYASTMSFGRPPS